MSTCCCCGQHIEAAAETAPASQVVRVDDAVLAICNAAFELARAGNHAHVEIAHAIVAVAMSDAGARALSRQGRDPQQAGQAADAWLGKWAQRRQKGEALSTSAELKQVLRAAEVSAQRAGRTHAALEDLLAALSGLAETVWSASFWSADAQQARSVRPPAYEKMQTEAPRFGASSGSRDSAALMSFRDGSGVLTVPAAVPAAAEQPSLLDREYAWLRDMKRTQVSGAAGSAMRAAATPVLSRSAPATAAAPGARSSPGSQIAAVSVPAATPRTREERERDAATAAPGGARVMHLFASPHTPAPAPAAAREDTVYRAILQRLDTQQRMIAELAEAFARSMRELAQARSEAAAAVACASSYEAGTRAASDGAREGRRGASGSSASSGGSLQSSSRRSGLHRSRSGGSWRRQSWSAWRRRRQAEGGRERSPEQPNVPCAWSTWPDRERTPRPEREHRAQRPDDTTRDSVLRETPSQPMPPSAVDHDTDETQAREKRFYLALDDDIEKAPSIGPRTAALLNAVGVMTVRDLMACDPAAIAGRVHNRYITAERLAHWQVQSRLVCTIPWLRGTHAQLLAGAGFDTIEKIVAADASSVCAAILKFAATRDGMSVLRSSPPPGEDWVIKRLEHARAAEPERAVA